jgi:hypothetical protein
MFYLKTKRLAAPLRPLPTLTANMGHARLNQCAAQASSLLSNTPKPVQNKNLLPIQLVWAAVMPFTTIRPTSHEVRGV